MHVARARSAARAAGASLLTIDDPDYPGLLREIHDPPRCLYVKGDASLLCQAQVAIVGSRAASPAALRLAEMYAAALVEAGLQVSSGLARGLDGAAHRAALAAGGKSIAVMATGIDRIYPRRHEDLAGALQASGCLVTEFPPGTPPRRENFPRRNRIISGLSLGVLVVEAALPSGSLITAGTALEQGREVFAVPWSPLHARGAGCLKLLAEGARLVRDCEDILEELGPLYALQQQYIGASGPDAGVDDGGLLGELGYEAMPLDELVRLTGRAVSSVLRELSELEVAGRVVRTPGGYIRS